jgi:hypothetical protein
MKTNIDASLATAISFDASPIDTDSGVVYAAMVLLGLYVLIVLEVSCIKCSVFDVKTYLEGYTEKQISLYGPVTLRFVLVAGYTQNSGCNVGVYHVCGDPSCHERGNPLPTS